MGAGLYIDPKEPDVILIKPKASEYKLALDAAGIPDPLLPDPDQDTNKATSDEASFFEDLKKLTRG
jgi:hypothetical protein